MTSISVDTEKTFEEDTFNDQYNEINSKILMDAIDGFKGAAIQFSNITIHEVEVRLKYIEGIEKMSQKILNAVNEKLMTVQDGASFASGLRNQILEEARATSAKFGKVFAENAKSKGRTMEQLLNKYSLDNFNKTFEKLTQTEKSTIYYEIIKSSGRDRRSITSKLPKLNIAARACIIVTIGLAIYNVIEAEDRAIEASRQMAQIGGGVAGAALGACAGASLASLLCGPAAPMCVVGISLFGLLSGGWAGGETAIQILNSGEEHGKKLEEIEELEEFIGWGIF